MGCLAHPSGCLHPTWETPRLYHAAARLRKVRWFCDQGLRLTQECDPSMVAWDGKLLFLCFCRVWTVIAYVFERGDFFWYGLIIRPVEEGFRNCKKLLKIQMHALQSTAALKKEHLDTAFKWTPGEGLAAVLPSTTWDLQRGLAVVRAGARPRSTGTFPKLPHSEEQLAHSCLSFREEEEEEGLGGNIPSPSKGGSVSAAAEQSRLACPLPGRGAMVRSHAPSQGPGAPRSTTARKKGKRMCKKVLWN